MKKMALAMLSALCLIVSCGPGSPPEGGGKVADGGETTGGDENAPDEIYDQKYAPELPQRDFGQKEINFLVNTGFWGSSDVDSDSQSGDIIADAVYMRNRNIEERHGFAIRTMLRPDDDADSMAAREVQSGSRTYDAAFLNIYKASPAAAQNVFFDLFEVPNMNFGKYYWNQNAKEELSIKNKLYFAASDINMNNYSGTCVMAYNKQLERDLGIEPIYGLVFEGKWTLDKFNSIIKEAWIDLDGDGTMGTEDFYGYATQDDLYVGFMFGASEGFLEKDAADMPMVRPLTEKFSNLIDLIAEIMQNKNATINSSDFPELYSDGIWQGNRAFMEDRALFFGTMASMFKTLNAQMQSDFGILPMPKYDESQQHYNTYLYSGATSVSVPNNLDEEELFFAGFVLEAMAAESRKLVVPAFYDVTMKIKYARDDESSQILDMIFEHRSCDLMYVNNFDGFYSGMVFDVLKKEGYNLASFFERKSGSAQKAIDSYAGKFE